MFALTPQIGLLKQQYITRVRYILLPISQKEDTVSPKATVLISS